MRANSRPEDGVLYLERSEHDLLNGGKVRLPEKLRLLPERKDLVLVDGADGGGDLRQKNKARLV